MSNSRALPQIMFSCLVCTAVIAETPEARAQASGGGQGSVPGLLQQQQTISQQQGNPGYFQGYVQQGQFPNQAAPGMFPGVPAGTLLTAKLEDSVDSGKAQVGDHVTAKLGAPLFANGAAVIPAGSTLTGSVTGVTSASNSNYQSPGSVEVQFRSVHTPDGRTLPITTSIKNTGRDSSQASSNASSGRSVINPGMAMRPLYTMGTMYAMSSMYSTGTRNSMAPMMAMMGMMGAMRMLGTGSRMGNRRGNSASEAKISKGTQLQLMLDQPIVLAMPSAIRPAASSQQPPQYAAAPVTYTQGGYAPAQPVPGLVQ